MTLWLALEMENVLDLTLVNVLMIPFTLENSAPYLFVTDLTL